MDDVKDDDVTDDEMAVEFPSLLFIFFLFIKNKSDLLLNLIFQDCYLFNYKTSISIFNHLDLFFLHFILDLMAHSFQLVSLQLYFTTPMIVIIFSIELLLINLCIDE